MLAASCGYGYTVKRLSQVPRPQAKDEINLAVPPVVQLVLAGGDAHLAANMATFRASVVSIEDLTDDSYAALSKVQVDASKLNPAQEDNYYLAQALLPWAGYLSPTMDVLGAASNGRSWDMLPLFFEGFNYFYFLHDYQKAGDAYYAAAQRVNGPLKEALLNRSAKFYEKMDDPQLAINVIHAIANGVDNPELKQFLHARMKRLEVLMELRKSAVAYSKKYGKPITVLDDLVTGGIIKELPADPIGVGFTVDKAGVPALVIFKKK